LFSRINGVFPIVSKILFEYFIKILKCKCKDKVGK